MLMMRMILIWNSFKGQKREYTACAVSIEDSYKTTAEPAILMKRCKKQKQGRRQFNSGFAII
jgi:hypothetical protein